LLLEQTKKTLDTVRRVGHVIGFMLVDNTVEVAESLQITARGGFAVWLYSTVVVFLGFLFFYFHKIVTEGRVKRERNPNRLKFSCCSCCYFGCCRRDNGPWDLRRRTRFVVAAGESGIDGVAILVAFIFKCLIVGIYDEEHMFEEHGQLDSTVTDGISNTTAMLIVFYVAWPLIYLVLAPISQGQLRKCRRRLPREPGSRVLNILRDISRLLETSSVFFVAWQPLPILGSIIHLGIDKEANIVVQNWIKVGILVFLSLFLLSRRQRVRHFCWYTTYLRSTNNKVLGVIVGRSFEHALSSTFLEGEFKDAHPYLDGIFFFLAGCLFFGDTVFGDTVATKMELEIDEMLGDGDASNNGNADYGEYIRLGTPIENEEEIDASYVHI